MRALLAGLAAACAIALPARAEPPVWVVRDADSEILMFGSVHVLPPGLTWRPAALDAALARADDLWFELPMDPATQAEVGALAARLGVLPPGQSLFTLLPPADAEKLMAVAYVYGVDKATLSRLEPWLAEVALAAAAYGKAGADTGNGVEMTINAAAPAATRRAFETPAEQMGFFDAAPMAEQIVSLRETLRELERDPEAFMTLVRAWMAGDTAGLDREALEPMRKVTPGMFRRLVSQRNEAWAKTLDERLKGKGNTVVVVGVGHLIGTGGLPARLRALGYSVTGP
ncbi:TraB/GumN family protein [uncultured Phenylobacterium sp.]|uniref:TraB/GumN family protein n=1 Tax=uncultured Phenylobacterium sp. TaxID=349273 RepID=UPI0025F70784|nr:TraB/GumN family protein [uncultured Phenylobacterium sp.]